MPIQLKTALEDMLKGWHDDIPLSWHSFIKISDLDFNKIESQLLLDPWEPIFPVRRNMKLLGAPAGSHIFKAFDGIEPKDVRCIILGQDPFPCPAFSTGRAFEAGNVTHWRELEKITLSPSIRCFLQKICEARTENSDFSVNIDAWKDTIKAIENGNISLPSPERLIDTWQDQGILPLNASFTISRFEKKGDPHQIKGHLPFWKPLVLNLLISLTTMFNRSLIILSFGEIAAEICEEAQQQIENKMGVENKLIPVFSPHPAAGDAFLEGKNPFLTANKILKDLGYPLIEW